MNNLSMPLDVDPSPLHQPPFLFERSKAGSRTLSLDHSMGMEHAPQRVAPQFSFTDPEIVQQLQEMEQETKHQPLVPNSLSTAMGHPPQPSHSVPPVTDGLSTVLGSSPPAGLPINGYDLSMMFPASHLEPSTSPPPQLSSMATTIPLLPPTTSTAPQAGGLRDTVQVDMTTLPPPLSPSATTTTGVPLSGVIPTRDGSQVTVGSMVAAVLDK